jgi:hypothetical protein
MGTEQMTWHEMIAMILGVTAIIIIGVGSIGLLWGYTPPPPPRRKEKI